MHGSETSCLVRLFGPIQDCSFWEALAEIVTMALIKSPAEVWVPGALSFSKKASNLGMRS